MARLPAAAYGGCKDASEAWAAGVLAIGDGPGTGLEVPEDWREVWEERVAIMVADGTLPRVEAERLAWEGLQHPAAAGGMHRGSTV